MRYSCVTALFALMLTGCGGAEVKRVSGSLLFDDQPLSKVAVTFYPETDVELGILSCQVESEDGTFTIVPEAEFGQGRAGRYLVLVSSEKDMGAMMATVKGGMNVLLIEQALGRPILPVKYGSETTTPLVMDIQKGVNELDPIELKSEPFPKCMKAKVIRRSPGSTH